MSTVIMNKGCTPCTARDAYTTYTRAMNGVQLGSTEVMVQRKHVHLQAHALTSGGALVSGNKPMRLYAQNYGRHLLW